MILSQFKEGQNAMHVSLWIQFPVEVDQFVIHSVDEASMKLTKKYIIYLLSLYSLGGRLHVFTA